jgi:nicotinate-nucleotide adenylyltransferase
MQSRERGGPVWGILGGSFDPVHNGHLHLAASARSELGLERVVFIPAARPPHKLSRSLVPAEDRLNMLRLAAGDIDYLHIDDTEILRGGVSYTFETLSHLRDARPDVELYFIIGGDSLAELATWKRIDLIAGLVTFAVLRRSGPASPAPPPELAQALEGAEFRAVHLAAPPIPVSSTAIRERIRRGESVKDLVPPAVEEYIQSRGLYAV